jgi:hypothetical protein
MYMPESSSPEMDMVRRTHSKYFLKHLLINIIITIFDYYYYLQVSIVKG